ncbi:hypothetical protein ACQ4LE_007037 [Meloidogyne hapla]
MSNLPISLFSPFCSSLLHLFFNYLPFASFKNIKIKNLKFSTILLFLLLNISFYCYADDLTNNNTLTNTTDVGNGTDSQLQTTTINWWGTMAVTQPDIADDSIAINTTTDISVLNTNGSIGQDPSNITINTNPSTDSSTSNSTAKNNAISNYQKYIFLHLFTVLFLLSKIF